MSSNRWCAFNLHLTRNNFIPLLKWSHQIRCETFKHQDRREEYSSNAAVAGAGVLAASVFKASADNAELSPRKMSSKSKQRETRANWKCKGSIQPGLLQKNRVLQPQKFRSQFWCSHGRNLDFLSGYFSLERNWSLPLQWMFSVPSGVKSLGTSAAMGGGKRRKEERQQRRVCLLLSFNRLQIEVGYVTLTFLWFNISFTQYWLLFERWIILTSWSS